MKKTAFALLLAFVPAVSFAASLEGTWIREFDKTLDGKLVEPETNPPLRFTSAKENPMAYKGSLLVKDDPGRYHGEVTKSLGKSIAFIKVWSPKNEYRAYLSFTSVDDDNWVGTWRDNRGNAGDVRMYRQQDGGNLSKGKPATQSSTAYGGDAAKAVDGNTDGDVNHNSITHTESQAGAWWQVDLGVVKSVNEVIVYNRTDCCGDRLNNFEVILSKTPLSGNEVDSKQTSSESVGIAQVRNVVKFGGVKARYVRIQLKGTNYLSLAEVEVMGK